MAKAQTAALPTVKIPQRVRLNPVNPPPANPVNKIPPASHKPVRSPNVESQGRRKDRPMARPVELLKVPEIRMQRPGRTSLARVPASRVRSPNPVRPPKARKSGRQARGSRMAEIRRVLASQGTASRVTSPQANQKLHPGTPPKPTNRPTGSNLQGKSPVRNREGSSQAVSSRVTQKRGASLAISLKVVVSSPEVAVRDQRGSPGHPGGCTRGEVIHPVTQPMVRESRGWQAQAAGSPGPVRDPTTIPDQMIPQQQGRLSHRMTQHRNAKQKWTKQHRPLDWL